MDNRGHLDKDKIKTEKPFFMEDMIKIKYWGKMFKLNKRRFLEFLFFWIIAGVGLIFMFIYGTKFLMGEFIDIFLRNLGKSLFSNLFGAFIISLMIALVIFTFLRLFLSNYNQHKNWWLLLTIFFIFFGITFGVLAIDSSIGNKELSLNLLDNEENIVGTIKCGGPLGPMIIEYKIICETNLNKKEQFIYERERIIPNLILKGNSENATMSYFALENTTYLSLRVIEFYHNETYIEFSTGSPYSFITLNEFKKNRERFIQTFLALIFVIFVTIPSAMINLRELWRSRLKT